MAAVEMSLRDKIAVLEKEGGVTGHERDVANACRELLEERHNLAMIVRTLCISKSADAVERAQDYLRRKGLQGSILRQEKQA